MLTWTERVELAHTFSPRLVLFPEDAALTRPGKETTAIGDYYPRDVRLLLAQGSLTRGGTQPPQPASLDLLATCTDPNAQLHLLGRSLPAPELAWRKYFDLLTNANGRARFPLTTYARVQTRGEANRAGHDAPKQGKDTPPFADEVGRPFFQPHTASDDDVALQYWFCYFYNDWANQHEGDWEGICLFLRRENAGYAPVGASYYAHETGKRRRWTEVERTHAGDTHPLVFVAAGSHASYFQFVDQGYFTTVPGWIIPVVGLQLNVNLSSTRVDRVPDARLHAPVTPQIKVLPDPVGPPSRDDPAWENTKWLAFPGAWGVRLLSGVIYGGPLGPRHKGLKWQNPFVWAERHCTPDFMVY